MVTGPHLHNFAEISKRLKEAGALLIAEDAQGVEAALGQLLEDAPKRQAMVDAGRALVEQGRGALAKTLRMIDEDLPVGRGYAPDA
jgi:3-deoxy-D-manno-octulosonic-acid transferase